jgi:hypothetical protein
VQRPSGTTQFYGPDTAERREAYVKRAEAIVQRYKGKIQAYEIWNEPNLTNYWQPKPNVTNYTRLVKAAYPRIKAADPSVTVIAGVTSPTDNAADGSRMDEVTFIQQAYKQNIRGNFDAWSTHPYTQSWGVHGKQSFNGWYQMCCSSPSVRSVMVSNRDGNKKLWATEFGAKTSQVSEEEQAKQIAEGYRLYATYPWAGVLFTYTLKDDLGFAGDRYGLLRTDWTRKPSFYSFQTEAGGTG